MTRTVYCVCCRRRLRSSTQGRTCSRECSVQMTEFANALRETIGLAPLYVMPPKQKEEEAVAAE